MAAARKDPVADVVTAVVIMAADVTMDVGFPLGTAPVDAGIFPCPLFQAYSKSILTFPCFFFNHALGRNSLLQIVFNPRYGLRTAFFLLTAPHTCHFLPVFLASFAHIPDPARIWHFHL